MRLPDWDRLFNSFLFSVSIISAAEGDSNLRSVKARVDRFLRCCGFNWGDCLRDGMFDLRILVGPPANTELDASYSS